MVWNTPAESKKGFPLYFIILKKAVYFVATNLTSLDRQKVNLNFDVSDVKIHQFDKTLYVVFPFFQNL